jgi:hypothetical protein
MLCQACIANNAGHCVRVQGIVARDGDDPHFIRHDDVLSLSHNAETSLLQSPHRSEMWDARDLTHA